MLKPSWHLFVVPFSLWLAAIPALAQDSASTPAVVTTPPAATEASSPFLPPGRILDEVSVTATRRPARARDTTVNTYVLRKEDFRSVGAITVRDALQLVPGFTGR
ncbi:outer membrane cobalamin receptor protein [Gloeobacter kilaueensis]|uniref:Outer membrane cobalamin receptor protein n=1 Tax=Gloeobacter kilaueensis (strain ATCC BAA-2537 / CCAP 1431/1 / ULC 316 / JS1) TaxID=1183438 RepID=U5QNV6_GLOK1|nr:outer membrane cobalamin receptor protein [Gloeobacter kilaueensis]AGY59315.1 outer membrane cobalamin receptor protein [Gloeobacter kilaueensis JS1]